jgi:hypothetical protein
MPFPDYVSLHWPDPGQSPPRATFGAPHGVSGKPAFESHRVDYRSGFRGAGDVPIVSGSVPVVYGRFDLSTCRGGDSPVS